MLPKEDSSFWFGVRDRKINKVRKSVLEGLMISDQSFSSSAKSSFMILVIVDSQHFATQHTSFFHLRNLRKSVLPST